MKDIGVCVAHTGLYANHHLIKASLSFFLSLSLFLSLLLSLFLSLSLLCWV